MKANVDFELELTTRGPVGDRLRDYAETKVRRAARGAPRPVLFARVALTEHENPSTLRPAAAKAALDVSGRLVRAHVAAPTMTEAVDLLADRLERRLGILSEHLDARRHEAGTATPGEWRHGDLPTARPPFFPRPVDEREVVEHKTYEIGSVTPLEAALDMELLGHDFYLFTNADTGKDAVLYRVDGRVELLEQAPELTVSEAEVRLDAGGEPFVFFVDRGSGRGRVLYHRYDGHYGLITPA
jgi:ribosome-associated translation inhibitor RaiA